MHSSAAYTPASHQTSRTSRAARVRLWGLGLFILVIALGLSACGGSSDESGESASDNPTPTVEIGTPLPTSTPEDTATPVVLPVTWTPQPTLASPTPKPTIPHTLTRPTNTPVILPSYTPTDIVPTATPPGPLLIITPEMLTDALAQELQEGSGGFFAAPPVVSLENDIVILTFDLLLTPGDPASARTLILQATVVAVEGRIEASHFVANFADDNALYRPSDITANMLDTLNTRLSNLVIELYGGGGERFFVSDVTIAPDGIAVQTVTVAD